MLNCSVLIYTWGRLPSSIKKIETFTIVTSTDVSTTKNICVQLFLQGHLEGQVDYHRSSRDWTHQDLFFN